MPGRQFNSEKYRFGFNGMEKDDEVNGTSGTSYDFKFRTYDPRIGKFLSLDPMKFDYPWNSPYAFAENDVIRAVDLEGLEKGIVIYSPKNAGRIKTLLKAENYKKVFEIAEYSRTHGWVDNSGKPSDFIPRIYEDLHGDNRKIDIPTDKSAEYDDKYIDSPLLRSFFGSEESGGGWLRLNYFNYESQENEFLGFLPLSKKNEHKEFTVYHYSDEDFWDTEPSYTNEDFIKEGIDRIIPIGQQKAEDWLKNAPKGGPKFYDFSDLAERKYKFAIKGRLRTLGPNSTFICPIMDSGKSVGYFHMNYSVDKTGKEKWTEHNEIKNLPKESNPKL